jgi:hypothetical protein
MANVSAGYNWVSGETVTPAKLNSAAAPTVVVADNEVTTAKILDANVTNAKLATGIDASKLTTGTLPIARVADGAVSAAKLAPRVTFPDYANGTNLPYTSGTVYQAENDIYITVVGYNNFMGAVGIYVGSTSSPSQLVWQSGDDINTNTKWFGSGPVPIPKNFYYKVENINVSASANGPESVSLIRYPIFNA